MFLISALILSGCIRPTAKTESVDSPTYNKDISPIIVKNCTECHHDEGPGPFSLTSYEKVKEHGKEVAIVTQSGFMPIWKYQSGWGDFVGEKRLTTGEKEQIRKWVENGCPRGQGQAAKAPNYPDPKVWRRGKPDMILKMSAPFTVPAAGPDIYRCFVLPIENDKDLYVEGTEFHSGNDSVTHHSLLFLDNTGQARKLDAKDSKAGYEIYGDPGFVPSGGLGNWAYGFFNGDGLPKGVSRLIKKKSDLVVEMHFRPTGKEEKVQTEVGLYLARKKPEHILTKLTLIKIDLSIPPGADKYENWQEFTLPVDTKLLAIYPHAHNVCNEMKIFAVLPDKKIERLMYLKDWDFNWWNAGRFKNPVLLPKGTKIKVESIYDNTAGNSRNPNHPPKRIYWGTETKDEMFFFGFDLIAVNENERDKLLHYINTHPRLFLYHSDW